jgi:glycosyltransferase involved in cell wall biosynthesis
MADRPEISVLIPWCDREEISRTLAANAHAFQSSKAEVIVINCGGDARRLRALILGSEVADVRQLNVEAPRFNKCLALNAGLLHSRAATIFVLDSDVILLGETLPELHAELDGPAFATVEWVYESEPEAHREDLVGDFTTSMVTRTDIEFVFQDGRRFHHQINRRDPFNNARAGRGLLMARKADLLKIQGYNSELHTWGWEDDDVLVRLQCVIGLKRVEKGRAIHLSHGDDRRVLSKPRAESGQFNYIKCCRNYNRGVFTGTLERDTPRLQASVPELVVGAPVERSGI